MKKKHIKLIYKNGDDLDISKTPSSFFWILYSEFVWQYSVCTDAHASICACECMRARARACVCVV